TPTNKNGEDAAAAQHPGHLVCYGAKRTTQSPPQPDFQPQTLSITNTNFGPAVLVARQAAELCVPAFMDAGPTTTSTSTTTTVPSVPATCSSSADTCGQMSDGCVGTITCPCNYCLCTCTFTQPGGCGTFACASDCSISHCASECATACQQNCAGGTSFGSPMC